MNLFGIKKKKKKTKEAKNKDYVSYLFNDLPFN
jgi:hypothetical protein